MKQLPLLILFCIFYLKEAAMQAHTEEEAEEDETQASAAGVDNLVKRNQAPTMTNIGYLLKGYNLLLGNPLDPEKLDPGFTNQIFQATYEKDKRTADQRWKIPDNVEVVGKPTCSSTYTSESVTTQTDYQNSLSAKASVSGSAKIKVVDASFSASMEYTRMSKTLKTNDKTLIKTEATCTVYEGRIPTGAPPKFTDNFLNLVRAMEEGGNYRNFLDEFGTHFIAAIDMGARYAKLQELSKQSTEKLRKQGIDVKLTASASMMKLGSVSSERQLQVSSEQKKKFQRAVEKTDVVSIGSSPPSDGKKETWISQTVADSTRILPISYRLKSISELFQEQFFQDVTDVNYGKIKRGLITYLKGYCKRIKRNRYPNVECEGPPKGCSGGSVCSANAQCVDNPSSGSEDQKYDCRCNDGYKGNGRICEREPKWMPGAIIEQEDLSGRFGTWGGMELCADGRFANGFLLRAERDQGGGDDTGANAVCIRCNDNQQECSTIGPWGDWSDPYMCPEGSFLSGWRQNVERHLGRGDDTSLDNVEYKCRDAETWEETDAPMKGQGKEWGTWSRFKECPTGEYICGINTKVEAPDGDDTALNDIRHQCCRPLLKK